jgi:hypothetical protein
MPTQSGKAREHEIVEYRLDNPAFGKDRVATEMRMEWIYKYFKPRLMNLPLKQNPE